MELWAVTGSRLRCLLLQTAKDTLGRRAGSGWALAVQSQCLHQAFTIMDQNRDGFIDKEDLRDTFAALGE